jgi:hypothetical protein
VEWEPSCFLSVIRCGEALYGMRVQGFGVLLLLGGFSSAKGDSSFSAKFLIFRAHTVCFFPLVAILDPPNIIYNFKNFKNKVKLFIALVTTNF